jgi:hypothetical protein
MKAIRIVIPLLLLSLNLAAQEPAGDSPATGYDRNSLTVLLLNFPGSPYMSELENVFRTLHVPDKFNDNLLDIRILPSPYRHIPPTVSGGDDRDHGPEINTLLVSEKIGNRVVGKWFSRGSDGTFSDTLLKERGRYNAKDGDVMIADASASHDRLTDQGERMIARSFVLVLDFTLVRTTREILGSSDPADKLVASLYNDRNGFVGKATAYLYQLIWNDSVQAVFYKDFWCVSSDELSVIREKSRAFEENNYRFRYLTKVTATGDGTQPNPETFTGKLSRQKSSAELFNDLVYGALDKLLESVEKKVAPLRVQVPVAETHPLRARIGRKEGLRVDQRYFVYEAVQTDQGIKMKRRGVVRATSKIADNRHDASGRKEESDLSKFYQTAGGRLDAGMRMQQRNDAGIGLYLGGFVQTDGFSNPLFTGGLDFNLSPLLGHAIRRIPHSIRLGAELSYGMPSYVVDYASLIPGFVAPPSEPAPSQQLDLVTTRIALSLSKDFYFLHVFRFTPFIGYAWETSKYRSDMVYYYEYDPSSGKYAYNSLKKDSTYAKLNFFTAGARLGINITHFMQLVVYFNALGPDYQGANERTKPPVTNRWMETGAYLRFEF